MKLLALLVVICAAHLVVSGFAQAGVITAQHVSPYDATSAIGYNNQPAVGQSFTAHVSGSLESIALELERVYPVDPIMISIYQGGIVPPVGLPLAAITSTSIVTGLNVFDFRSFDLPINADDEYLVVAAAASYPFYSAYEQYAIHGVTGNPYLEGVGFTYSSLSGWRESLVSVDYIFTASVSIPEPGCYVLLMGVPVAVRRRGKKEGHY